MTKFDGRDFIDPEYEIFVAQMGYWVFAHYIGLDDDTYLIHICSQNRNYFKLKDDMCLITFKQKGFRCPFCKKVPPEKVIGTYLLLNLWRENKWIL